MRTLCASFPVDFAGHCSAAYLIPASPNKTQGGEGAQHSEQALLCPPKEQIKVDHLQWLQIDQDILEAQYFVPTSNSNPFSVHQLRDLYTTGPIYFALPGSFAGLALAKGRSGRQ